MERCENVANGGRERGEEGDEVGVENPGNSTGPNRVIMAILFLFIFF